MTDESILLQLVRCRAPSVLVVHQDGVWHEHVAAAAQEIVAAGHRLSVLHARSIDEATALVGAGSASLIGCFVPAAPSGDKPQALERLQALTPTLLVTVALVSAGQPVPRLCLDDATGFYLHLEPHKLEGGAEAVVDQCRSYLLWMLDRFSSLTTVIGGADQIAKAPSVEIVRGLMKKVFTSVCKSFRVDGRLVEDLDSDDDDTQLVVRTSQDALILEGTYEAIFAEHLRMRRHEQKPEAAQAAGEAAVAEASAAPLVEGFKCVSVDGQPHWFRLARWSNGARTSGMGIARRIGDGRSEQLVLASFGYVFAAWLAAQERLAGGAAARGRMPARIPDADAISELVAGVAHEINTPLGVIVAAGDIIREVTGRLMLVGDPLVRELEGDLVSACEMLQKNADRLAALVKKFRNTSSVQTTEPLVRCHLGELIEHAVEVHRTSVNGSPLLVVNCDLDVEAGAEYWRGYPQQLTQVLVHLLVNAEQHAYRRGGGVVDLRVRGRVARAAPVYTLSVTDYGVGIAAENLPRIFDAFFTTDRTHRSTGLGLAVVYNIVTHSLKGTVSCESSEGVGTTFVIEFSEVDGGTA